MMIKGRGNHKYRRWEKLAVNDAVKKNTHAHSLWTYASSTSWV